jgi:hypothetical protein
MVKKQSWAARAGDVCLSAGFVGEKIRRRRTRRAEACILHEGRSSRARPERHLASASPYAHPITSLMRWMSSSWTRGREATSGAPMRFAP